jgi:hypothetical protein
MSAELADRLDRSIGPAPESDDLLAGLLAAGHGAVRRRRVAAIAGAAAAVLVVAGGVAVATGGSPDRATPPVGEPTSTASTTPPAATASATATVTPEWDGGDELAFYDSSSGQVTIRPGATVVQRIDNPYHLRPPRGSVAVAVAGDGTTIWYVMVWDPSGTSEAAQPADPNGSFRQWVHDVSSIAATDQKGASQPGTDFPGRPEDGLVVFVADHGELLGPLEGVVVLEQREGVDVGPSFASEEDDTAAAEVRAPDGKVFYVLARRTPGEPPQYIAVPRSKGGADLDAFLAFARERYAEGSGLL